jgi:hypothetical protein
LSELFSHGKRAASVVALASDFDFAGSRFLARLTAVFFAILCHASTWQVRALLLFVACHQHSPYLDCFHRGLAALTRRESYSPTAFSTRPIQF